VYRASFPDGSARLTIADPSCRHNWQHLQRIKNDLLGEEWEGVELYPQQSRLCDEANLYHLWCRPTAFNVGWDKGGTITALGSFFKYDKLMATA
jgi:hypothetical protein